METSLSAELIRSLTLEREEFIVQFCFSFGGF